MPSAACALLLCLQPVLCLTSCGVEGKACSLLARCCDGLACEQGDSAEESTCRRTGQAPSREENKERLKEFYAPLHPDEDELETVLERTLGNWEGREELMCAAWHVWMLLLRR